MFQVKRDGKCYGPFTIQQMKAMAQENRILPTDLVTDGKKWLLASEVKGLLPKVVELPPAPKVAQLPPAPSAIVPTMPHPVEQKFLVARGLQVYGPFTVLQIKQGVDTGSIIATDRITREGGSEWVQAGQIPELFPQVSHPPYQQPVVQSRASGGAMDTANGLLNLGLKAMSMYWLYESADTNDAIGDWYREH